MEGLDQNAIDFMETYDGSENEPEVMPAKFPNLLANIANKIINACAIKTPDFGDEQIEILKDIQSMIGGTVFNSDLGDRFLKLS